LENYTEATRHSVVPTALIELSFTIGGTLHVFYSLKWVEKLSSVHKIGTRKLESFLHLIILVQVQVNAVL